MSSAGRDIGIWPYAFPVATLVDMTRRQKFPLAGQEHSPQQCVPRLRKARNELAGVKGVARMRPDTVIGRHHHDR
jgi:hypothetical protein